jgi:hypothetical protein
MFRFILIAIYLKYNPYNYLLVIHNYIINLFSHILINNSIRIRITIIYITYSIIFLIVISSVIQKKTRFSLIT